MSFCSHASLGTPPAAPTSTNSRAPLWCLHTCTRHSGFECRGYQYRLPYKTGQQKREFATIYEVNKCRVPHMQGCHPKLLPKPLNS